MTIDLGKHTRICRSPPGMEISKLIGRKSPTILQSWMAESEVSGGFRAQKADRWLDPTKQASLDRQLLLPGNTLNRKAVFMNYARHGGLKSAAEDALSALVEGGVDKIAEEEVWSLIEASGQLEPVFDGLNKVLLPDVLREVGVEVESSGESDLTTRIRSVSSEAESVAEVLTTELALLREVDARRVN